MPVPLCSYSLDAPSRLTLTAPAAINATVDEGTELLFTCESDELNPSAEIHWRLHHANGTDVAITSGVIASSVCPSFSRSTPTRVLLYFSCAPVRVLRVFSGGRLLTAPPPNNLLDRLL